MKRYVIVHHDDQPVALVMCDSKLDNSACLALAWRLTNNREGSWSLGPEFDDGEVNTDYSTDRILLAPNYNGGKIEEGLRSSMRGDEFVLDGITYVVDRIGFQRKDA